MLCLLLRPSYICHQKYQDSYWMPLAEKGKYNREVIILQMATYWFVIAWFDNQSVQKRKVRQAAKDIVKSEIYP